VPYFHVVFTLPARIADIAYQNKAVIYDLLFKASSEAVLTIAADPKHMGATIGITAVLHTWSSTMTHHPHVHMIVPGGGISLDGQRWIACRRSRFILPGARPLGTVPQADAAKAPHRARNRQAAVLRPARHLTKPRAFAAFLGPLWRKKWFVYTACSYRDFRARFTAVPPSINTERHYPDRYLMTTFTALRPFSANLNCCRSLIGRDAAQQFAPFLHQIQLLASRSIQLPSRLSGESATYINARHSSNHRHLARARAGSPPQPNPHSRPPAPRKTNRGFVLWRLPNAGPGVPGYVSHSRHP